MLEYVVYCIRNRTNDAVYIGCTGDTRSRWEQHRSTLRHGKHVSPILQAEWNVYGADAFEFCVISTFTTEAFALCVERSLIKLTGARYNRKNALREAVECPISSALVRQAAQMAEENERDRVEWLRRHGIAAS